MNSKTGFVCFVALYPVSALQIDTAVHKDETEHEDVTEHSATTNDVVGNDNAGGAKKELAAFVKRFGNETIAEKNWHIFSVNCGTGDCCDSAIKDNKSVTDKYDHEDLQKREENNERIDEWMDWWKDVCAFVCIKVVCVLVITDMYICCLVYSIFSYIWRPS